MHGYAIHSVQKGAFWRLFVFALWLLPGLLVGLLPGIVLADCPRPASGPQTEPLEVVYVIDGDTLILADGRHVRLIGINTPEKDSAKLAALAALARRQLTAWLAANDNHIRLAFGPERKDHYERTLAYVFAGSEDMGLRLLSAGLAWFAVVPPNQAHVACYRATETRARRAQRGLWQGGMWQGGMWQGLAITPAKQLTRHQGFILTQGHITRVSEPAGHLVLTLDDTLDLFIHRRERKTLDALPADPAALIGKRVEARGWLYDYKGTPNLRIMHPAMLNLQPPEE